MNQSDRRTTGGKHFSLFVRSVTARISGFPPRDLARTEKNSRFVYLQLGHGPSAFNNPDYRKLRAQSIRWTAKR